MTISSETRKAGPFVGDSVTTVFPFTFKVFVASDLSATLLTIASGAQSTLVLDTDYTVALNADQNSSPGGSITFNPLGVPMPSTQTLTIGSVVAATQGTTLVQGGAFIPGNIVDMVDRAMIVIQQALEKVNRAIRFPIVDGALVSEIPSAAIRAGQYLTFDASGNLITGSAVSGTVVSAAMIPLVQAVDAAAARAVIGAADATASPSNRMLLNGSFNVNQRGTTFTGADQYTSDRWYMFRQGSVGNKTGSVITGSIAGLSGSGFRLQRDAADTSTAALDLAQAMESVDSIQLQGRMVTLSFYAKCGANFSAAGNILSAIVGTGTGTDQSPPSVWTGVVNQATNFALTTSYQRFSCTVTCAANITQAKVVFEYTPVGTAGANDWFEVAGVQLERASSASLYQEIPFAEQISRCQRYYQRRGAGAAGVVDTTSQVGFAVAASPQMRGAPTVALIGTPAITVRTPGADVASAASALVASAVTQDGGFVLVNGWAASLVAAGRATVERLGANFVTFDAEL